MNSDDPEPMTRDGARSERGARVVVFSRERPSRELFLVKVAFWAVVAGFVALAAVMSWSRDERTRSQPEAAILKLMLAGLLAALLLPALVAVPLGLPVLRLRGRLRGLFRLDLRFRLHDRAASRRSRPWHCALPILRHSACGQPEGQAHEYKAVNSPRHFRNSTPFRSLNFAAPCLPW